MDGTYYKERPINSPSSKKSSPYLTFWVGEGCVECVVRERRGGGGVGFGCGWGRIADAWITQTHMLRKFFHCQEIVQVLVQTTNDVKKQSLSWNPSLRLN